MKLLVIALVVFVLTIGSVLASVPDAPEVVPDSPEVVPDGPESVPDAPEIVLGNLRLTLV